MPGSLVGLSLRLWPPILAGLWGLWLCSGWPLVWLCSVCNTASMDGEPSGHSPERLFNLTAR